MVIVGDRAPGFDLESSEGTQTSLNSLSGRWFLLFFYPKDDTPGCTQEACSFTENLSLFASKGVDIFGISPDSLSSHQSFIKKHNLEINLLSDPEHKCLEAYGAWVEKSMFGRTYMGVNRSTVLVDPDGVIRHVWEKVKVTSHVDDVLKVIDGLIVA